MRQISTCALLLILCVFAACGRVANVEADAATTVNTVETKQEQNGNAREELDVTDNSTKSIENNTTEQKQTPEAIAHHMQIETSMGIIVVQLKPEAAPKTVANIRAYIDEGFYNGTVFHRVIKDFMIQGGGFVVDKKNKRFQQRQTHAPIKNEGDNGLSNLRGTIAMARTSNPDSATSQFYINVVDNTYLDAKPGKAGYCVFGEVIQGIDVVDKISKVPTTSKNWPVTPVIIQKVTYK